MTDLRELARALGGHVGGLHQVLAPAPGHSPQDRSLSVRLSPCAPDGFIVHGFAGDNWRICRDHVRTCLGIARTPVRRGRNHRNTARSDRPEAPAQWEAGNHALALELWHEARDVSGTLVEDYLTRTKGEGGRALDFPHECAGRVLRFHPKCPWRDKATDRIIRVPAMIAALRCIHTNRITAVHRTALDASGRKIDRRMLGPSTGTAIKLDSDAAVTMGLVIGEGIETCLAARQLGLRPVWALGSVGAIRNFPVLPGIDVLTILEERDDSGASPDATRECGERWLISGREVVIARPRIGSDLNDALMETGNDLSPAA